MLKLKIKDDDRVIVRATGQSIQDFDNILDDLRLKFGENKRKKMK
jgi:hypothetical protein